MICSADLQVGPQRSAGLKASATSTRIVVRVADASEGRLRECSAMRRGLQPFHEHEQHAGDPDDVPFTRVHVPAEKHNPAKRDHRECGDREDPCRTARWSAEHEQCRDEKSGIDPPAEQEAEGTRVSGLRITPGDRRGCHPTAGATPARRSHSPAWVSHGGSTQPQAGGSCSHTAPTRSPGGDFWSPCGRIRRAGVRSPEGEMKKAEISPPARRASRPASR